MATTTVAGGSTANSAIADSTGNGRDGSKLTVEVTGKRFRSPLNSRRN